jgi:hypothetical protein
MIAIAVYLLVGFILLRTGTKATPHYPGPARGVWYVVFWLPIEISAMAADTWAEIQLQHENAVLQILFDDGPLEPEQLKAAVVTNLCGEELGSLGWYCVLKFMVKEGWLNKQVHEAPDHLNFYRTEVWYSLTESGIREVRKRGLE